MKLGGEPVSSGIVCSVAEGATLNPPYRMLTRSYERHLRATNKAPMTVVACMAAIDGLGALLADHGMRTDPAAITREHVEAFISFILTRAKPATALNRSRALGTHFRWTFRVGLQSDKTKSYLTAVKDPGLIGNASIAAER